MNTDIRLSTEFFRHPKTLKLKRRLGLEGIFSLQQLWVWVAQNRSNGNLAGLDTEDIALAACWEGDEGTFVQTLIDLRWLDVLDDGVLCLHNWASRQEYAAKSEERIEKAKKAAAARWNKDAGSSAEPKPDAAGSSPQNADGIAAQMQDDACGYAQTCSGHQQAMPRTDPNLTEVLRTSSSTPLAPLGGTDAAASDVPEMGTDETQTDAPAAEPVQAELVPEQPPKRKRTDYRRKDFEEWKAEYGVKVDDDRLWKVWRKQILKIPEQAVLMAALARYKQSRHWQDGFIKKPDNYLRDCCWNDDFAPAQPAPRRSYGPDANGRTPYVREDEMDFSNVPLRPDGSVSWEDLAH